MHEQSLVRGLIRQIEHLVGDDPRSRVTEVHLSIGPLSGVEPLLVRTAFEQLTLGSRLSGAGLKIDQNPLQATCRECGTSFTIDSFRFECSTCRSRAVQITSGDEFKLLTVTVEETEPNSAVDPIKP